MSMRTYGASMFGLALTGETLTYFMKKYIELNPAEFEDCPDIASAIEEFGYAIDDDRYLLRGDGNGEFEVSDFMRDDPYYPTVSIFPVSEKEGYHQIELPIVIVLPDKTFSARSVLKGGFYNNADELVAEYKSKLQRYLPDDFDWLAAIGEVDYAYCC